MVSFHEQLMPPNRDRELDHLCMKISSFAMFFATSSESKMRELVNSFPEPDKFYDGPPTVGDAKKFFSAILKHSLAILLES